MSAKVKLMSLISAFVLVLGIIVIGVLAVSQQTLRMTGSVNFNVDDKSLYVKQVRIKQDNGTEPEPVIGFLPGYINGDFEMNIGDYSGDNANTVGSFALYFDIINTTTYDWIVSDVSLSTTLQSQNVSVSHSGDIDAGTSTEIADTTPLSGTIILTISSPNATSIDLSGITIILDKILPTPASSFTFSYNNTNHTASITGFNGSETEVIIPSAIEYNNIIYTVTGIDVSYAFNDCESLTSITIPKGVTGINNYHPFQGCHNLTTIEVDPDNADYTSEGGVLFNKNKTTLLIYPRGRSGAYTIQESVTSIEPFAFYDCISLTSVNIPEGVTTIGSYAFDGCSSLTSITIPESVTSINDYTFQSCYALAEVYNYSNVTTNLPSYAKVIYNANDLKDGKPATRITVVDNVQYYNDFIALAPAVARDTLTEVTLDSRTTEINQEAFSDCSNLTSITIPDSVTSIGEYAFSGCSSLTSITIPSSVTSIGERAFSDCNFSTVTIDSSYAYQNAGDGYRECGYLLQDANTVRVSEASVTELGLDANSYLNSNFNCDGTPVDGYYVFTRNQ